MNHACSTRVLEYSTNVNFKLSGEILKGRAKGAQMGIAWVEPRSLYRQSEVRCSSIYIVTTSAYRLPN